MADVKTRESSAEKRDGAQVPGCAVPCDRQESRGSVQPVRQKVAQSSSIQAQAAGRLEP